MDWLEIAVDAEREASEAAYAVLSTHAPGRIAINEPVAQTADGDGAGIDFSRPVTLKAYLPLDGSEAAKQRAIEEGLWYLGRIDIHGLGPVTTRVMVEADWANAWKDHYHTRRIGKRLVIHPSWLPYQSAGHDAVVELDPGMAFGTGLHPTTETCLLLLEDVVQGGEQVLDVGTGSGILSLAALALGASRVLALDTDDIAVQTAVANLAHSGCADRADVQQGTLPLPQPRSFSLVLANIIARVLIELAPELRAVLGRPGWLLASGIIAEREGDVIAAFSQAGLHVERRVQSGDWVTLVAR